ncbi:MAG: hypothetical protein ACI8W8_004869 [Rhodothermales bacterium]|jgi:hypothetical protein
MRESESGEVWGALSQRRPESVREHDRVLKLLQSSSTLSVAAETAPPTTGGQAAQLLQCSARSPSWLWQAPHSPVRHYIHIDWRCRLDHCNFVTYARDGFYGAKNMRMLYIALAALFAISCPWAGALDDQRRADLARYLDHLCAGGAHNVEGAEALSDLSFGELRTVIARYVNEAAELGDPAAFHELLLRNSDQYILSKEFLRVYAPDFLAWLHEDGVDRAGFTRTLAASDSASQAADLAVRLLPEDSLVFIYEQKTPFRQALLQAWCRRLVISKADPAIRRGAMQAVLRLDDDSEDFLRFKGYWRSVDDTLKRLFQAESRERVVRALGVQALHPLACKYNPVLIGKWSGDTEIVIQALTNIGRDSSHDHAEALRELWSSLPNDNQIRNACLQAMGTHPAGNAEIAKQALKDPACREPALAILRDAPEALKQGLQQVQSGSDRLGYATKYQVLGFESLALKLLAAEPELALSYLHQAGHDKAHDDRIASRALQVFRTAPAIENHHQALTILGRLRRAESADVFREILGSPGADEFALTCWTGLAQLGEADALEELARRHANSTPRERMDVLQAYLKIGKSVESAFADLASDIPQRVATAAALIREHGDAVQKKRLRVIHSRRYWYQFSHPHLDTFGIVSHYGHNHGN